MSDKASHVGLPLCSLQYYNFSSLPSSPSIPCAAWHDCSYQGIRLEGCCSWLLSLSANSLEPYHMIDLAYTPCNWQCYYSLYLASCPVLSFMGSLTWLQLLRDLAGWLLLLASLLFSKLSEALSNDTPCMHCLQLAILRSPFIGILSFQLLGSLAWLHLIRTCVGWLLFLPWSHAWVSSISGLKEALLAAVRLLTPAMYFLVMMGPHQSVGRTSHLFDVGIFLTMGSSAWTAIMLQVWRGVIACGGCYIGFGAGSVTCLI